MIKISIRLLKTPLKSFLDTIPDLIEKCKYDDIVSYLQNERMNCDIVSGLREVFQNLIDHYTLLAMKDPRYIQLHSKKKESMEEYLDNIINSGKQCKNESILFNYLNDHLNTINSKKQKLDFKKFFSELTVCQLFNLKCEKDEILSEMINEYEKCREVNLRLHQIIDSIDKYNLTAEDIIEIIGNVQIKYLIKVFPKLIKDYKTKHL